MPCYHLTYTCWASFRPTMYFSFIQFTLPSIFAGLILMLFWAFLAHFISFGHPQPALFLWASSAYFIPLGILGLFILTFPWAFATSFGLPRPNYHILYFRGFVGLCTNPIYKFLSLGSSDPFYLLSISYNFHELTTSFFEFPWTHLLSFGCLYYLIGLWIIIPAILV